MEIFQKILTPHAPLQGHSRYLESTRIDRLPILPISVP